MAASETTAPSAPMVAEASWLPKAKELRLGERRRTDHDCGPGRTLIVEHNEDGYRGHCFRCNDRDWRPPDPVPLAVRLERLRQCLRQWRQRQIFILEKLFQFVVADVGLHGCLRLRQWPD